MKPYMYVVRKNKYNKKNKIVNLVNTYIGYVINIWYYSYSTCMNNAKIEIVMVAVFIKC